MIEIVIETPNYVAYIDGTLYHYSASLAGLLEYLARRAEEIESIINE